jgi:PAS domain S-box-containing protein
MESSNIRILVIDDNHDNQITIKALIKDVFPEAFILTASDAKRGIELAAAEDPDVILLDIVMPGTDGFETCKKLKADKNLCDIPVVFITALKDDKENRILALEVGAEAFLAKPVEIIELTAQIRAMVKIKTAKQYRTNEKDRLAALVAEQTLEIRQTQTVTLNLLEEVTRENEARKKSEASLKQSEEYLRNIFENAPVGIFHSTLEGQFLTANQTVATMIGYSDPEELVHATADITTQVYADPKIRPQLLDDLKDTDGWLRWDNVIWQRKDGSLITVSITGRKVLDAKGDFVYLEGFVEDITKRRQAENKIQNQLEELQRWHKITIGREDRNRQLKKEVNDLLIRLGETIRYPSQLDENNK